MRGSSSRLGVVNVTSGAHPSDSMRTSRAGCSGPSRPEAFSWSLMGVRGLARLLTVANAARSRWRGRRGRGVDAAWRGSLWAASAV